MSVLTDYGLKEPDVEFLLAVHKVEQNPTEYDNTDKGETVANTTSIREACDLSRSQVDYRVSPGDGGRGFGEEGMALIRTHEAVWDGRSVGPRSVELTEKGQRVVAEIKEMHSGGSDEAGGSGGVSSDRIAELEAQVSEHKELLESFSEVAETVERFEQNEMGAVNGEMVTQLRAASNAIPHHQFVFSEVFGIGIEEMRSVDADDEEGIRQLQVAAYNHLQQAIDTPDDAEAPASSPSE